MKRWVWLAAAFTVHASNPAVQVSTQTVKVEKKAEKGHKVRRVRGEKVK